MTAEPKDILAEIKGYEDELIAIRRDIHAHPETGFEEVRTAALVAKTLRGLGIETHEGIAKTGVVGTLKGTRPGNRAVALRADMDALFIEEKTGLPYASTVPGKMHACGHDGHTAMLLGAARYLSENRDFAGTVHFIFQPAEEGLGGGQKMVEEGLFDRFPADAVYGMHNNPGRAVGEFGLRPGPMLAASDTWTVAFGGTGGHGGSAPHLATDPTVVLAHFILAAQAIVGRNVPAVEPAVISVGHVAGGSAGSPNIIPPEVVVSGTARSYSPKVRDTLERRLRETAEGLAATYGCTARVDYQRRYPPLVNHPEQTDIAAGVAASIVGADKVATSIPPITGAEDFSFMLEQRPGAFIMIGNGVNPDGSYHYVHTPHYDFNDAILALGSTYWVTLVRQELGVEG
ncbi:M20 aminoacylase family protein [Inquilinus limosus]|uniref:Amidohydrolase n=1 Tax=Inquilinus limosus MP06 TaxID=1398085 RepID=A0A0A0D1T0_9PROT|nr:M20 aminoacylase family protein [Inquilinus limosus]KGM32004.1 amidohydrolase [Inquilinus limosus MP06]